MRGKGEVCPVLNGAPILGAEAGMKKGKIGAWGWNRGGRKVAIDGKWGSIYLCPAQPATPHYGINATDA